jgi:UDP-N-acetylglucosamine--N-acetylmuramyl-(pentapeptide) pyrophosphoryl-undecaprenol N-acetylglucosamine transferase
MGTRLAIFAGGTGGHVFPALAIATFVRNQGWEPYWIGTQAGIEAQVVPEHHIPIAWIDIKGLRHQSLGVWLAKSTDLMAAFWRARAILKHWQPHVALGMGGFTAGPSALAAYSLGIPFVIHEQNSRPGLTNRILARFATTICEAFPGSFPAHYHARWCGNPVRPAIQSLPHPEQRLTQRTGHAVHLLVIGGSLGAQCLNESIPHALARLPDQQRPQVWHQAGHKTLALAQQMYAQCQVTARVEAFIGDMAAAYAWADLVICRAGALTIAELTAAGLPALLIPYPHAADNHQLYNAHWLVECGAARLMRQDELSPSRLAQVLDDLIHQPTQRLYMACAARQNAQPEAITMIVNACREAQRACQR